MGLQRAAFLIFGLVLGGVLLYFGGAALLFLGGGFIGCSLP